MSKIINSALYVSVSASKAVLKAACAAYSILSVLHVCNSLAANMVAECFHTDKKPQEQPKQQQQQQAPKEAQQQKPAQQPAVSFLLP